MVAHPHARFRPSYEYRVYSSVAALPTHQDLVCGLASFLGFGILGVVKSIDLGPTYDVGLGLGSPRQTRQRRLMHKCESGISRNRDNQCRIAELVKVNFALLTTNNCQLQTSKLRWHREKKIALIT
mgnify:CR=1 FL=1